MGGWEAGMSMGKLGIVVAGGPAPGINGVIAAATEGLARAGVSVVGVQEGFRWLREGDTAHVVPLHEAAVADVHRRGGSILGTSRASPIATEATMDATLGALERLGIRGLVTIGGEGTAFSAYRLAERSLARRGTPLRVVHVPKTIDNDLDLPDDVDTFGFQTARQVGVGIVKHLMMDARATSRWYVVVAQGRKVGHLALGIGKAAGAALTLIPEELLGRRVPLAWVVDTIVGSILKRRASGRLDGVAVVAEGIADHVDVEDLARHAPVPRDGRGDVHVACVDLGAILRRAIELRLRSLGVEAAVSDRAVGYELRCADPIAYDVEYTKDLGYCAARTILDGASHVIVSMRHGDFRPIPLGDIVDLRTGRARVRRVDVDSDAYRIARAYMVRLERADLDDPRARAALVRASGIDAKRLRTLLGPRIMDATAREPIFDVA
jgi:6-phosphofructokinase